MKYRYKVTTIKEAQHVLNITKWCGQTFDDRTRILIVNGPSLLSKTIVDFYFQNEADMMAFKLMWNPNNY